MCDKILAKLGSGEVKFNSTHEFFMIPTDPIIQVTNAMKPGNALARMEEIIKKRKSDKMKKSGFKNKVNGHKPRGK